MILADVAVSRRHLIVIREGDVLRLRDLGSGNGTQVNGKKIGNVVLTEGDRIELGETVLVVRTPGGTPMPALDPDATTDESHIGNSLPPPAYFATPSDPMSSPQGPGYQPELTPASTSTEHIARASKNAVVLPKPVFIAILFGASLLLAMLGAAVAILVIRSSSSPDDEAAADVRVADSGPYDRGLRAYQAHHWDEAEEAMRAAHASGDSRANPYLSRIEQAREHEQLVGQARAALERGDANTALTQASSVPADSPLAAQAAQIRREAQSRQVAEHLAAARTALASGDSEEARRRLALARSLDPANQEVRTLAARLDPAPAAPPQEPPPAVVATPEPAPAAEPEPEEEEDSAPRGGRAPRRSRGNNGNHVSTADVITAYLAGHFDQATRLAHSLSARASGRERRDLDQLAANVERFGRLYGRIQAARFGPSVRSEMEQAMALDHRIARSGQYRDRLRGHVVDAYLADAQRQRSNPVASCSSVRHALVVDPNNVRARQMSAQCETRAQSMMREAAAARPERAMQVYQSVVQMVPSQSAVARQANDRLDALRRRRVVDEDE